MIVSRGLILGGAYIRDFMVYEIYEEKVFTLSGNSRKLHYVRTNITVILLMCEFILKEHQSYFIIVPKTFSESLDCASRYHIQAFYLPNLNRLKHLTAIQGTFRV